MNFMPLPSIQGPKLYTDRIVEMLFYCVMPHLMHIICRSPATPLSLASAACEHVPPLFCSPQPPGSMHLCCSPPLPGLCYPASNVYLCFAHKSPGHLSIIGGAPLWENIGWCTRIVRYLEFRGSPLLGSSKCIVSMGYYIDCYLLYSKCPLLGVFVIGGSTVHVIRI